ncbi:MULTISPECIES: hypothetical protein [Pseudoalteromonas]|jgi:hypothetical protein|uniref:Uncharacterized protein n=1 Tax=Pseudoalteromonas lipolytica TaxID=570156 RepID=A0A0P7D3P1_9GAMM|nr:MULTISPECIES: hypothetical protein [Pseudoalteromonas]MEC8224839.1 hypothetical protein [Pseudomonadota bacterium]KPM82929.1 hypothetical protein AOG27_12590 [Pseudoalteromonas lipolytica]MCF2847428.1 hypothetical protein [Pseudoalteromonas sp. PAST1]MCF2916466.1 hypothetical protein [Pseudoalteromonas sp. Cn5-37]MCH2086774.1 hypothetical protein [Pseudoalteromonas sp.]|tara:strand:- start:384 stop:617 length:234 start_codon:yes stop_codon:yes gene_type:complete
MKFYIVKKDSRLAAIPAQESILNEYQERGFKFVEVINACDESDALSRTKPEIKRANKWLIWSSSLVILTLSIIIFCN